MNRKVLWAVLVIGAALVIAPFALSLPSKAGAGERMLGDFQPIMQPDQVRTTARRPGLRAGFSRLWFGPATNPSSDVEIWQVTRLMP